MFRFQAILLAVLSGLLLSAAPAFGQGAGSTSTSGTFGSRTLGAGGNNSLTGNRSQGLEQTGQVTSSAGIQRQQGAFVGGAGDASNFLSRQGGGRNAGNLGGGLGGFGGGFGGGLTQGRGTQGFGGGAGGAGNTQRTIRARLRVSFSVPARGAINTRIQTRLPKIPQLSKDSTISVAMQGRTAVLRGVVPTEHDRDLAGRLVMLEPGVSDVQNELAIAPKN